MTVHPNKAKSIFLSAAEIAESAPRQTYLDAQCAGDPTLRREVDDLLQHFERVGTFLESAALDPSATVQAPPRAEGPGTVLGPYKLLEQIGEGGMGLVFVAEQQQPVKRRVALKIIKPGMDSRQVIARFEAERQALAMMDHPNIARILDAGVVGVNPKSEIRNPKSQTNPKSEISNEGVLNLGASDLEFVSDLGFRASDFAGGRPYFVMELVHGEPITTYCDDNHLTPRERLELIVLVFQAIQHAHQKGIIHRDIKPSNVLVTLIDGKPAPKVFDFGVAKAVAGVSDPSYRLTERSLFTQHGTIVGALEYMSPEQAETSALGVDTRSDIYSLGVLLYELLTGAPPLERKRLREAAYNEVLRLIREEDPPRPSTRLSSSDTLPAIAAARKTEPAKLSKLLRGELDWIVMKALERDRARRYETADGLARDVRHDLADEPVEACPPSAGYRLGKFAQRNRRALATVGIIALALVAATVVCSWQAVRAHGAQLQAEDDRDKAAAAERRGATEAAIARAVSKFLQEDLLRQVNSAPLDDMGLQGDPNLTVREALHRAATRAGERFRDQPLVEAAIRTAIGEACGSVDEHRLAAKQLERAVELRQAHLGPDHPETLRSTGSLAGAYAWIGRAPDAIVLFEHPFENHKSRLGPNHPETLGQMHNLALACRRAGDWRRAKRLSEQVVEKDQALRGATAAGASGSAHILATIYQDAGEHLESAARLEKVLALGKLTAGPGHDDMLYFVSGRALGYQRAGKLDEADRVLRDQLELRRKRGDSSGQIALAGTLEILSLNLLLQNQSAEAEQLAREALALDEKNEKNRPDECDWRRFYLMNLLGGTLLGQKKYADAEPLLLQGYEGLKQREAMMIAPWRYRLTEAGERLIRYYEATQQPEKARNWREKLQSSAGPN